MCRNKSVLNTNINILKEINHKYLNITYVSRMWVYIFWRRFSCLAVVLIRSQQNYNNVVYTLQSTFQILLSSLILFRGLGKRRCDLKKWEFKMEVGSVCEMGRDRVWRKTRERRTKVRETESNGNEHLGVVRLLHINLVPFFFLSFRTWSSPLPHPIKARRVSWLPYQQLPRETGSVARHLLCTECQQKNRPASRPRIT